MDKAYYTTIGMDVSDRKTQVELAGGGWEMGKTGERRDLGGN